MSLKEKTMIPFIFILIGSVITIAAGYFDYRNKLIEEQKRSDEYKNIITKSNSIIENNNQIIKTQETVIDTAARIIKLQNELNEKNIEIQNLQSTTLNYVTGGKNVPKLYFIINGYSVDLIAENKGDYPIRNVSVEISRTIFDYFIPDPKGGWNTSNPDATKDFSYTLGDIPIKSEKRFHEDVYKFPYNDFHYRYTIRWQNGFYSGMFECKEGHLGPYKIEDAGITNYSEGFDLKNSVCINGKHSEIKKLNKK